MRCIGSDPATAHGLRPYLALIDEPAQHEASTRDRMLAAIKTGLGKTPGSRMLALGTRPSDSSHWFSKQLTGAGVAYAQVHAAGDDDPPFAVRTWRKANPSLAHLPSLRAKYAQEAASARHSPELLAAFRALRLNMGVEDTDVAVLLDAGLWEGIEGAAPMRGKACWGVDLGATAAQSAVAAYFPETGALLALAAFPREPDLHARGIRDGVGRLYVECANRRELLTLGNRTVNVADLLGVALDRFGPPVRGCGGPLPRGRAPRRAGGGGDPAGRPRAAGHGLARRGRGRADVSAGLRRRPCDTGAVVALALGDGRGPHGWRRGGQSKAEQGKSGGAAAPGPRRRGGSGHLGGLGGRPAACGGAPALAVSGRGLEQLLHQRLPTPLRLALWPLVAGNVTAPAQRPEVARVQRGPALVQLHHVVNLEPPSPPAQHTPPTVAVEHLPPHHSPRPRGNYGMVFAARMRTAHAIMVQYP